MGGLTFVYLQEKERVSQGERSLIEARRQALLGGNNLEKKRFGGVDLFERRGNSLIRGQKPFLFGGEGGEGRELPDKEKTPRRVWGRRIRYSHLRDPEKGRKMNPAQKPCLR